MTTDSDEEKWTINGFIPFVDLAACYFPNSTTHQVASRKLRVYIRKEAKLLAELEKYAYSSKTTTLSPKQQQVIISYWGIPQISLRIKNNFPKNGF